MSRCADYFRNFKNGRRCHGNGQNAKKMIIAGYSPNRNWWNLLGTTSTSSGWTNFAAVAMETNKGGFKKLLNSFHQSVTALAGLKKIKMAAIAMVTKVQTMLNSLQTEDLFETWHKSRSSLKVVLFILKIFQMTAISKWPPI